MGIIHGTLVRCKTFKDFICCRNIFIQAQEVIETKNIINPEKFEYQGEFNQSIKFYYHIGLLQEDTTIEIKDQREVKESQETIEIEMKEEIKDVCTFNEKLISEAPGLLNNIIAQLNAPVDGWQLIYKEKKKPHQLSIYTKTYTTAENNKVNILRSSFYIGGVLPQSWLNFYNDIEVQRSLDSKLDRYVIAENYKNYFIVYCSYRKMLMIDSRDIIYFKAQKKIGDAYVAVCKSVELEAFPLVEGKTRAEIFLSGQIVKEDIDKETNQVGSYIQMYSDVDMKMNVPALISRPAAIKEIKSYVEKSIEKLAIIKDKYLQMPDII